MEQSKLNELIGSMPESIRPVCEILFPALAKEGIEFLMAFAQKMIFSGWEPAFQDLLDRQTLEENVKTLQAINDKMAALVAANISKNQVERMTAWSVLAFIVQVVGMAI